MDDASQKELSPERGASLVEYVLLVLLVSLAALVAITQFGRGTNNLLSSNTLSDALSGEDDTP